MVQTCVWVQASVLGQSLGEQATIAKAFNKSSSDLDLDRTGGGWDWTLCDLLSGDISALETEGSTLSVRVIDQDSEYHDKSVTIPYELMQSIEGQPPKVLMANDWVAQWASANASADSANGSKNQTHHQSLEQLAEPPDDMINLTHLHEASVVHGLKRRYQQDMIYTATGPILLAVNPFKPLPALYDDAVMNDYWLVGEKMANLHLKPHIFMNAHTAFRGMMDALDMKKSGMKHILADQSVLVSGESGSGKTVSTKHVMKYLATLSQRKAAHSKRRRAASPGRAEPRGSALSMTRQSSIRVSRAQSWKKGALIEEKILESNPILEAFGNARTIRNDNSSRFGKFIELQFKETGSLIGAKIETYLLEKVRLVHQSEGERNFHVFYEFLAAADDDERDDYLLGDYEVSDFKLTSSSGTFDRRDGANDVKLFDELVLAMNSMGFEGDIQEQIFACTASFLHASNLSFLAPTEESSKVDDSNPHVEPLLTLLGLEKDAFNAAMTEFEIDVGQSTYTRQLTVDGAQKTLEAFIKGTYGAMFSFIVETINKKIDHKPKNKLDIKAATISVLDIFGFESFEFNTFEQLCINYCNEALQQQFNLFIFKSEQEEYKREGIKWDSIKFPDNKDVLDVIDMKGTGILSILTDQCRAPKGTDKSFLDAIYKQHEKHKRFLAGPLQKGKGEFIISHYAGPVLYHSNDFVEKNKDETPRAAAALLQSSTKALVQLLGKSIVGSGGAVTNSRGGRSKKRPTVASQFSSQLADLRQRINNTRPHYIRCLKPNQDLEADKFVQSMIADQLRYAGVLEAIRVSRIGYSQRYSHDNFVTRYHVIASSAVRGVDEKEKLEILQKEIAKQIWERKHANDPAGPMEEDGIQRGHSKVFLRQSVFEYAEKFRSERIAGAAVTIQRVSRGYLVRSLRRRQERSAVTIQSASRGFFARILAKELRKQLAVTRIQACLRMHKAKRELHAKKAAGSWLQRYYRGQVSRKMYKKLYEERKAQRELEKLHFRSAVVIQGMYRARVARAISSKLRDTKQLLPSQDTSKLEGAALRAAIQSDRAAAVAMESTRRKSKELNGLNLRLEGAKDMVEHAKLAVEELKSVKAELANALAALEKANLATQEATARADRLEAENRELKARLDSADTQIISIDASQNSIEVSQSTMYDDYSELKALDEKLRNMVAQSKQSKKDLKALVEHLSILR